MEMYVKARSTRVYVAQWEAQNPQVDIDSLLTLTWSHIYITSHIYYYKYSKKKQ